MNTFRRLSTSVRASFGFLVDQIENHEALVNAAIKEIQEASARARVQFQRVKADGEVIRRKLSELHEAEQKWNERAIKVKDTDEQKAIECVRSLQKTKKQISTLEEQERVHKRLEVQLADDIRHIDEKLANLKRKRNSLATRQSRSEALGTLNQIDSNSLTEIDEILERWEIKVVGSEIGLQNSLSNEDALEEEFRKEEDEKEIKQYLKDLSASQNK